MISLTCLMLESLIPCIVIPTSHFTLDFLWSWKNACLVLEIASTVQRTIGQCREGGLILGIVVSHRNLHLPYNSLFTQDTIT